MAILNYNVIERKNKQQLEDDEAKRKQKAIRASKQSVVNNAMMTKVPSQSPQGAIQQPTKQGWGNANT